MLFFPPELERKALKITCRNGPMTDCHREEESAILKRCLRIHSASHQSGDICICSRIGARTYRSYTAKRRLFLLSSLSLSIWELMGLELCSLVLDHLRLDGISKEILYLTRLPLPPSGHLLLIFSLHLSHLRAVSLSSQLSLI